MPHRSTQGQPRAIGTVQPRWQWLLMAALLATIPAFYLELLDAEARWGAGAVYLLAALILLAARWHQWHLHADQGGHHQRDALGDIDQHGRAPWRMRVIACAPTRS